MFDWISFLLWDQDRNMPHSKALKKSVDQLSGGGMGNPNTGQLKDLFEAITWIEAEVYQYP